MKRVIFSLIAGACVALAGWCEVTVGVTVQLTQNERDLLPDKSIEVTYKTLKYDKKANEQLVQALDSAMSVVAENAYMCRTFLLNFDGKSKISITSFDPVETGSKRDDIMGTMVRRHCHFLVLCNADNKEAVSHIFKRDSEKVKYVREFEFVEAKIAPTTTCVEAEIDGATITFTSRIVDE